MKGTLFRVLWVDLLSLFFPCFTFRHLGWVFPSIGFRSNRCRGWCLYVLFRGAAIWHVNTSWFLHKFLYRWVAECCKWKQKPNNEYSVVIVEWHTCISPFQRHGLPSKPSFRRAVPWRNHHRRDKYCGETTLFFTVEILPKELNFRSSKTAPNLPSQTCFFFRWN